MSYDLMVFETSVAPRSRKEFMEWYHEQTEWNEDHSYDDHSVASKALQNFFLEFIEHFPPLNGPLKSDDIDDPKITDHCIGKNVIYSSFRWSVAEEAFETMRFLSVKHSVGFFGASSDTGELLFPGDEDVIQYLELDEIESRIIPIIQLVSTSEESDVLVTEEFQAGLNIHYGVDNGDSFQLLSKSHLPPAYDLNGLKKKATQNLTKLIEKNIEIAQADTGVHAFLAKKCHPASIILLDKYWMFAKTHLKNDLAIAIPSSGLILFVPASDKKMVEKLKKMAHDVYKTNQFVLTEQLFKHDGNTLSLFEEDV